MNLSANKSLLPNDFKVLALQTESLIKLPTYFSYFDDFCAKFLIIDMLMALVITSKGVRANTINVNCHEL